MSIWETKNGEYHRAVKFRGWNGIVFKRGGPFRPQKVIDNCKVRIVVKVMVYWHQLELFE